MSSSKQLWLLAGGNGAGKSTFYKQFLEPKGLPFINADILAKELDADNAETVSYRAAKLVGKLRKYLLESGCSFCFETVFSHPSKIDFLAEAKARGYQIILIYIHLDTNELNLARVAQRVQEGGHSVPSKKVIARIPRTIKNVKDALSLVDIAKLYDNSSHKKPYVSIAELDHGVIQKRVRSLPTWAKELLSIS